jgi:hypothetical protein
MKLFGNKSYDDAKTKAEIQGYRNKLQSEKLLAERQQLKERVSALKRKRNPLVKVGEKFVTYSKREMTKMGEKPKKKNRLDNFFD